MVWDQLFMLNRLYISLLVLNLLNTIRIKIKWCLKDIRLSLDDAAPLPLASGIPQGYKCEEESKKPIHSQKESAHRFQGIQLILINFFAVMGYSI